MLGVRRSLVVVVLLFAAVSHALSWHEGTTLHPPNPVITVCWMNSALASQFTERRATIQNAVLKTWSRVANITFSGWGACSSIPNSPAVRIDMVASTDGVEGATTFGQGTASLHTDAQGRSIWFQVVVPSTTDDRVRYLAVHEFGHVLGFQHEMDSPLRDPGCTDLKAWERIAQVGPWDRLSVMNAACNAYGNSLGYLSPGDIAGVRQVYGKRAVRATNDFLLDGTSDWGFWSPTFGMWRIWDDSDAPDGSHAIADQQWGTNGDIPVAGDYNGDGRADYAVWRPSTKEWFILGQASKVWGEPGDSLVPADYNGDGKTDRAVWRPSTRIWYVDDGVTPATYWGEPGDVAVPGDYSGDGSANIAIWRPSTGEWYIKGGNGRYNVTNLGTTGDIPVPGDYLGEGKVRPAVFRPSTGQWLFTPGHAPAHIPGPITTPIPTNLQTVQPLVGDYDGNGIADPAAWVCEQTTGANPCKFVFNYGFQQTGGGIYDTALPVAVPR